MDSSGIQTAIMSLSIPGVYFGDINEAIDLARSCNEFAAEMKVKYPNRFGSFAVLPMPFTDKACAEAIYALDVLKADGIILLGLSMESIEVMCLVYFHSSNHQMKLSLHHRFTNRWVLKPK